MNCLIKQITANLQYYLFVNLNPFSPLNPAIGDKMIEVIGVESALHAGQVKAGIRASGRRLAQCSNVTIRTHKRFPMQIDGEPWVQPPCTVSVHCLSVTA